MLLQPLFKFSATRSFKTLCFKIKKNLVIYVVSKKIGLSPTKRMCLTFFSHQTLVRAAEFCSCHFLFYYAYKPFSHSQDDEVKWQEWDSDSIMRRDYCKLTSYLQFLSGFFPCIFLMPTITTSDSSILDIPIPAAAEDACYKIIHTSTIQKEYKLLLLKVQETHWKNFLDRENCNRKVCVHMLHTESTTIHLHGRNSQL